MNILFTCAGRRTYLLKYFKENMSSEDKVVATDMQLTAPALQVADVKLQVPAVSMEDCASRGWKRKASYILLLFIDNFIQRVDISHNSSTDDIG